MKTTGAEWNAFLASWPDDHWFDDSDETFDGKEPTDADAPANAVVEFSCGVVLTRDNKEVGDLVRMFKKWQREQTSTRLLCEVPNDKIEEMKAALKDIGAKVIV